MSPEELAAAESQDLAAESALAENHAAQDAERAKLASAQRALVKLQAVREETLEEVAPVRAALEVHRAAERAEAARLAAEEAARKAEEEANKPPPTKEEQIAALEMELAGVLSNKSILEAEIARLKG